MNKKTPENVFGRTLIAFTKYLVRSLHRGTMLLPLHNDNGELPGHVSLFINWSTTVMKHP